MTKINAAAHFFNHFKMATNKKRLCYDVHITKRSKQLLQIFYQLNMIRRYSKSPNNVYRVYPTYSIYRSRVRYIRTFFRSGHDVLVPIFMLRLFTRVRPFSHLILETNKGILTHAKALEYGLSGKLIMIIH